LPDRPAGYFIAVRLVQSDPDGPGIRRRRHGKGFRYVTDDGEPIGADLRERIKGLVIPPAWQDVWICPDASGHIQAIGVDAAGRKQYLYHEQWRTDRDAQKHARVLALARKLPDVRAAIAEDLRGRGLTERRVLAGTLRMLDLGVFRPGGEEYAEQNGSYGATTLLLDHAEVDGDRLLFSFPAKSGVRQEIELTDRDLTRLVRALLRAEPETGRLLSYRDGRQWQEVRAAALNARFKELAGKRYTVKDLRTWHATVFAAKFLARREPPTSKTKARQVVSRAMRAVADELGNTPAVARRSYVDPKVVAQFDRGETIARALRRAESADSTEATAIVDRAVIRLLTQ
jgi:DNA topoisomerase I